MKRSIIRLLMAFVLMNLFCFTLAIAEPVDDYVKFKEEKYYLLDKENFSKITCKVKVPIIDNMLENIKAQLKSRANVVQINENVSDFTMTYLRGEEIKFNKPYFDIKVISPEGIKNKESFYAGVEQMKNGFNQQVDGVIQMLQGVFEEFMTPNNAKEKVSSFIKTGDETKVSIDKEGVLYEEIYKGTTRITAFKSPQLKGQSIDEFQDLGGHLLLAKSNAHMEQQGIYKMDTTMEIVYQEIQGLNFPSKITNKMITESGGLKQEGIIEIILENCSIE